MGIGISGGNGVFAYARSVLWLQRPAVCSPGNSRSSPIRRASRFRRASDQRIYAIPRTLLLASSARLARRLVSGDGVSKNLPEAGEATYYADTGARDVAALPFLSAMRPLFWQNYLKAGAVDHDHLTHAKFLERGY
jgi:hypothetical protein